jgi:hypothetical protein
LTEVFELNTDESEGADELFSGPDERRQGPMDSDEILIGLVQALYPGKPYCLVEDWTIFKVDVTEDELQKIQAAGQLPLIVFARNVRVDSQLRFNSGDWVRTTFATSFEEGFLFETRNTVYVLAGVGYEKTASFSTIMSIF